MKFIKVKDSAGKVCLVNLSNVAHLYQRNETETTIFYISSEDYMTVPVPIDVFYNAIDQINDVNYIYQIN